MSVAKDQLTDALNATFITYNGNELTLQNDMGNSKIQDKKTGSIMGLKEGFIPMAMKEHGGILYIASYNPEKKLSELGSIPSPLFDYTVTSPQEATECKQDILGDRYTLPNTPILLSLNDNVLLHPGDAVRCVLDISSGENGQEEYSKNLQRQAYVLNNGKQYEEGSVEYPLISTREQVGLVTLHLVVVPTNSTSVNDLMQHEFGPNKTAKQWFDTLNTPASADLIVFPNIQSGQLAIRPELASIHEIQLPINVSTGRTEPYYISQDVISVTINYKHLRDINGLIYSLQTAQCTVAVDNVDYNISANQPSEFNSVGSIKVNIPSLTGSGKTRKVSINGQTQQIDSKCEITVTSATTIIIEDLIKGLNNSDLKPLPNVSVSSTNSPVVGGGIFLPSTSGTN